MLTTNVVAIDLAKNVLQICYISVHGDYFWTKLLADKKLKSKSLHRCDGRMLWVPLLEAVC